LSGQGVGLHSRLTNWLGSFGVCASFEPLGIVAYKSW
jgi:hypothetical protein